MKQGKTALSVSTSPPPCLSLIFSIHLLLSLFLSAPLCFRDLGLRDVAHKHTAHLVTL